MIIVAILSTLLAIFVVLAISGFYQLMLRLPVYHLVGAIDKVDSGIDKFITHNATMITLVLKVMSIGLILFCSVATISTGYFWIVGGLCGLVSAITQVFIVVQAFKQGGTNKGLLTLFVPFYIFYFVFSEWEFENKGLVVNLWLGGAGLYVGAMMISFII